jgi:MFS family permease
VTVVAQRGTERAGLRDVFATPAYRRLWAARTASQAGDVFAGVALALLVFDLTGSGIGVSVVVAAEILPVLLLAPLAGALVDRWRRVRVMICADLLRAALATALVFVNTNVAAVYVITFAMAVGSVFFNPAANSTIPALVTEGELVAANSGIWTAAVLSQIALAPAAGGIYASLGPDPAFGLNAASFLLSAGVLARLELPVTPAPPAQCRWFHDAADGVRLLVTDPLLRALGAGQILAALSAGATSALLVVLAREQLDAPASSYGLLIGGIGVGAALGPLVLTRFVDNPRRPAFVFGPFALRGAVDIVLAATTTLPVAMGALLVYGLATSTGAVTFNSVLQAHTPPGARGRVFSSFDLSWQLGRLLSIGLGGLLADTIGISAVYYLGGVLLLIAALIGWTGVHHTCTGETNQT